jgi:hypothetical protein
MSYIGTDNDKLLLVILRVMNNKTFGLRYSEKIVGGRARLESLICEGKIRARKANENAQNGKWQCNAADVLRYARID